MPTCPSDDELVALALGQLAAAEAARVNAHLADCAACAVAAAEAVRSLSSGGALFSDPGEASQESG